MNFELRITITGICAFVENENASRTRVCVVMPSTDTYRTAIDEESLCPHESYIEQGYAFGRTPLRGRRVWFEYEEAGTPNPPIYTPIQVATYDRVGLINIEDAPVNSYATNPDIVSEIPPEPVMAQVLLDKGTVYFSPKDDEGTDLWYFHPGYLFRPAHEVIVVLRALRWAKVILEPFNGYGRTIVDVTPRDGVVTVDLRIVNACIRGYHQFGRAYRDRDFKWYYDLLEDSENVIEQNEDLPIPRFFIPPLIGGNNCFSARLRPVKFNL